MGHAGGVVIGEAGMTQQLVLINIGVAGRTKKPVGLEASKEEAVALEGSLFVLDVFAMFWHTRMATGIN